MVIIHTNTSNATNTLNVCIPINATSSNSSQLLTNIFNDITDYNMNTEGDSETFVIQSYNLNKIVPYNPYFYYQQKNTDIIVYGLPSAINITSIILNDIASYITPYADPAALFPYESNLFYNIKGPGVSETGEIFIDCQPVNSSTEKVNIAFQKTTSSATSSSTATNKSFLSLISNMGFNYTTVVILCVFLLIITIYVSLAKRNELRSFPTYKYNNKLPNMETAKATAKAFSFTDMFKKSISSGGPLFGTLTFNKL